MTKPQKIPAKNLAPPHVVEQKYLQVLTACLGLNIFLAKIQALCSPKPDAMSLCL
jgi:hypothetical protein